nr:adenylate/guanylate cyclase domain-containing protein [Ruegeria sp. HKCCA0235A]
MERDEKGTLEVLSAYIDETAVPLVGRHYGRIVKQMGDGLLASFDSAVDAVSCAVEWQNSPVVGSDPLRFRIGVTLGDIIMRDGDVFGSGVNLASRLEQLAPPGGVLVSDAVLPCGREPYIGCLGGCWSAHGKERCRTGTCLAHWRVKRSMR